MRFVAFVQILPGSDECGLGKQPGAVDRIPRVTAVTANRRSFGYVNKQGLLVPTLSGVSLCGAGILPARQAVVGRKRRPHGVEEYVRKLMGSGLARNRGTGFQSV